MRLLLISVAACAAIIAGCSLFSTKIDRESAENSPKKTFVELRVLRETEPEAPWRPARPPRDVAWGEKHVVTPLCKAKPAPEPPSGPLTATPAIVAALLKAAVNVVFGQIEAKIREKLEQHSASYDASTWLTDHQTDGITCLQLVRGSERNGTRTVEMDLIFAVWLRDKNNKPRATNGHPMPVYPIRLYYAKPATTRESASSKYVLAGRFKTELVTATNAKTVFDQAAWSLEVQWPTSDKNSEMPPYYYKTYAPGIPAHKDPGESPPFEPWDYDPESACNREAYETDPGWIYLPNLREITRSPPGAIRLTAATMETGEPDGFLAWLAKFTKAAAPDTASALADYAKARLEKDKTATTANAETSD